MKDVQSDEIVDERDVSGMEGSKQERIGHGIGVARTPS